MDGVVEGEGDARESSAIGDFGGDYGNYLKLLESDSALGFNPQADPIGDNQVTLLIHFSSITLEFACI